MVHPLFPRVVVYISKRSPSDFEIVVQAKSGYSYPWTTVVRERASTASKARGIAHLLGTAWEKRASAAGKYELVHGAPPAASTRGHGTRSADAKRHRRVRGTPRGPYNGPAVRAAKHNWGHGYAYSFRWRGETYSGQRHSPSRSKAAAITAGRQVARSLIEWERA